MPKLGVPQDGFLRWPLRGGLHDKKGSWLLSTLRQFWLDQLLTPHEKELSQHCIALRPKKCWKKCRHSRCAGSRHFCSCTGSSPENQDILPWNHSCARQILSGKHGNHNVAHWALLKATPVSLSIFLDHTASKLLLIATANVLAAQKTTASGPPKMTQVLSRDTPPACRKTACAGQCAHQTCQQTLAVSHRYQMVPKIMARQHLHGRNSSIFLHTFVDVALIYLNALHGLIQWAFMFIMPVIICA